MHRAAGGSEFPDGNPAHRPGEFLRLQQTKELIAELETAGFPAINIRTGRNGGSFSAKEIVYAYANWISAPFYLKVIRTFDAVVTGNLDAGAEFPSKGFAKLEHSDFMVKVPKVLKEAAPKFFGTDFYLNGTGAKVSRDIYTFPKRESCLMAMSYSYDIQAKVFDRHRSANDIESSKSAMTAPGSKRSTMRCNSSAPVTTASAQRCWG